MNLPYSLWLTVILAVGCLGVDPSVEGAVRVLGLQGELDARSRVADLQLELDGAVDVAARGERCVALVPWRVIGHCEPGRGCGGGRCVEGVCWGSVVDEAFVADLSKAPLSARRRAATLPLALRIGGRGLRFALGRPLAARRPYSLLVARCAATGRGRPLAASDVEPRLAFVDTFVSGSERVPRVSLLSPRAHAEQIPLGLERVVVGVSERAVGDVRGELWLEHATFGRRELVLVERLKLGVEEYLVLEPLGALAPGQWGLGVGELQSESGQGFFYGEKQLFELGTDLDREAPVIAGQLELADHCAVFEVRASEVVDIRLKLGEKVALSWAARVHYSSIGLDAGTGWRATLDAWDMSGKRARQLQFQVPELVPSRLQLVEVLANPLGPEPRQEFVEILNSSADDVALEGWVLYVGEEQRALPLPPFRLRAGGRAVLVSRRYEEAGGPDPALAPLAAVVRLERSLSLTNSGEPIRLVGPQGEASSYGGYVDTSRKADGGKSAVRVGRCDVPESWVKSEGLSTPGAPGGLGN